MITKVVVEDNKFSTLQREFSSAALSSSIGVGGMSAFFWIVFCAGFCAGFLDLIFCAGFLNSYPQLRNQI